MNSLVAALHQFVDDLDPIRLRAVIAERDQIITALRVDNARLRKENRELRRKLSDLEFRLLRQAESDAILMGGLFLAGHPTSRRACREFGIGSLRWRRAVALLAVGRAHDGRGFAIEDSESLFRSLRIATERVTRDGMDTISHRMPVCYTR